METAPASPILPAITKACCLSRRAAATPCPFSQIYIPPPYGYLGRDDLSVPTAKSVLNLEKLRAAGRDNITVVVYADTGHSLRINPGGLVRGNFDSPSFVSGYFPQQLAWLVEQGFLTSN